MLSSPKRWSAFVVVIALAAVAFTSTPVNAATLGAGLPFPVQQSGKQSELTESPSRGTAAMGPSLYNGQNLYKVNFATGSFVNVAPGKWEETDAQGKARFTFAEVSRAFESVALHDASRDFHITLDLMKKQVLLRAGNGPTTAIYTITSMVYPTPHLAQAATSQQPIGPGAVQGSIAAGIAAGISGKPPVSGAPVITGTQGTLAIPKTPASAAAQGSAPTAPAAPTAASLASRVRVNTPTGYFEAIDRGITAFGTSPYTEWTEHASDGRVQFRFVGKPSPVGFTLFDSSRYIRVSLNLLEQEARLSTGGGPVGFLAKIVSYGRVQGGKFIPASDAGSSIFSGRSKVRARVETETDTFRREGDRKWVQVRKSSPGVTFRTYVEATNPAMLQTEGAAALGMVASGGPAKDAAGERGFVLLYEESLDLSLLLDLDTKVMTTSASLKAQPILQGE